MLNKCGHESRSIWQPSKFESIQTIKSRLIHIINSKHIKNYKFNDFGSDNRFHF